MRIGRDGNLHAGFVGQTGILGRQVQPVRLELISKKQPFCFAC